MENAAAGIVAAVSQPLMDLPLMRGVKDFVDVLNSPGPKQAERWGRAFVGSFVPNVAAPINLVSSPELRMVETWQDAIYNKIPGMKEGLALNRTVFGEPMLTTELTPVLAWGSPVKARNAYAAPIYKEMLELGVWYEPKKDVTIDGVSVELDAHEFSRLKQLAGTVPMLQIGGTKLPLKEYMNEFIKTEKYLEMKLRDPEMAGLKLKEQISTVYKAAKYLLMEERPGIVARVEQQKQAMSAGVK
jgi:hypothetical protein